MPSAPAAEGVRQVWVVQDGDPAPPAVDADLDQVDSRGRPFGAGQGPSRAREALELGAVGVPSGPPAQAWDARPRTLPRPVLTSMQASSASRRVTRSTSAVLVASRRATIFQPARASSFAAMRSPASPSSAADNASRTARRGAKSGISALRIRARQERFQRAAQCRRAARLLPPPAALSCPSSRPR